jgi:hypothetical protein
MLLVPPAPAQVNEYAVLVVRAPVPCVPFVALVPVQPPEAVQAVALVELHVSVEVPPLATTDGLAVNVAMGTILTVTVDVPLAPPGPTQVIEYRLGSVMAPVLCVPLTGLAPLQPSEAAQDVALVELHVSVETPPLLTEAGFAVSVTPAAGVTVAVAALLLPPGPVQINEYDVVAVRGPVLCVPLAASAPLQPPEAVQAVALVELQVSVEAPPLVTEVGFAASVAVGADPTLTVAVAVALEPPGPVQINEYEVADVRGPVLRVPLTASAPVQPPEAVQDVASVELHVSVEAAPLSMVVGLAASVAVGTGATVTVTDAVLVPPAPVQVNEYEVVAVRALVLWVPLVASAPVQPPEAVQAVALVELHVSVDAPPSATLIGTAVIETLGFETGGGLSPPPHAAISSAAPEPRGIKHHLRNRVTLRRQRAPAWACGTHVPFIPFILVSLNRNGALQYPAARGASTCVRACPVYPGIENSANAIPQAYFMT